MFAAVKQRAASLYLPSYTTCVQHLTLQLQSAADCVLILSVCLCSNLSGHLAYILCILFVFAHSYFTVSYASRYASDALRHATLAFCRQANPWDQTEGG